MRVGVTQRVEYVTEYEEVRDCLDQRWSKFLDTLEMTVVPIPNTLRNVEEWLSVVNCDAYLLTGGNDLATVPDAKNVSKERDRTEISLLNYAQSRAIPVFGVCRGLQMINVFMGGQLDKLTGHVATRHLVRTCFDGDSSIVTRNVNSFHDFGISLDSLSPQLIPCAYDSKNNVESARHKNLNWLGIMWHPEREKTFEASDLNLLKKHFKEGLS